VKVATNVRFFDRDTGGKSIVSLVTPAGTDIWTSRLRIGSFRPIRDLDPSE
jgi:hypothetical protein